MKGTNISQVPVQAVRFMKLAGIILVLFTIINYVLLLFTIKIGDTDWSLNFTTTIVEEGIVPILGIALMFCAYGFEEILGLAPTQPKLSWNSLKFWVYLLSFFLGIIFLLIIPLHISNTLAVSNEAVEAANQTAKEEKEILEQRLDQQQNVIGDMLRDRQKLEAFTRKRQLSEEQIDNLEKFKNNPNAFKVKVEEVRSNLTQQIERKQQREIQKSQLSTFHSSIKIGLTSLLLASCYLTIGWSGFRGKPRRVR
ncbi:MAG: hypothetical protein F6K23_29745 [Okeania sp. SIO2C9]|uniref:HpsJ family protein n=1 Tax=Okeania sp. SIO2C9 TaxID=2607791 RepID=UPI0013BF78FB|nr:HpsJ family protein [Okeania sp. SIO2C9]NEQ76841.1 hypothetical protein [Okeania sp. SIO2C9]